MDWFEDASHWQDLSTGLFDEGRCEAADAEVQDVLALSGTEPPARVLDMCCGPGRHAIRFAQRGFQITGVDLHQRFLDAAQARVPAELTARLEWTRADARRFVRPGRFQLAVILFGSFGYFDDPSDDAGVLANVATSLSPEGIAIVDVMGRELLGRLWEARTWERLDQDCFVLTERSLAAGWESVVSRSIVVRGGGPAPI